MLTIDSDRKAEISGGPLPGVYEFTQLHFHWGGNDSLGSENKIEGRSFPMELHMVFAKKGYLKPLEYNDGLTVLAFFFEVAAKANVNYKEFSELLPKLQHAHTTENFKKPLSLANLVHTNLNTYFTYKGR